MIHEPLTFIGKYRIESELGRGGMGVVYRAFDTVVERPVAIKTIGEGPAPAKLLAWLKREAKAVGQLEHPNIVSLYDAGETDGHFYMVMQLVHGETMHQRISRRWDFTLQEILATFRQLLQALSYAHAHGVVHRDIKPANIMITPGGIVKVADFGVAKFTDAGNSSSNMAVGSPSYMSPEQVLGRAVDARSDIFALGCVLYELVTGKKAFAGSDATSIIYKIVHEAPPPLDIIVPDMPACIETLILKALAKNPDDRFSSCASFGRALEACISHGLPPVAHAETSVTPSPVPVVQTVTHTVYAFEGWNRPVVWIAALLGMLCALLVALLVERPAASTRVNLALPLASPEAPPSVAAQPPPELPVPVPAHAIAHTDQPPVRPLRSSLNARQLVSPNLRDSAPDSAAAQHRSDEPAIPDPVAKLPATGPEKRIDPPTFPQRKPAPAPPATFASLLLQGDIAFSQYLYAEALAHYLEALKLNPTSPALRHKLAVVYTMLGKPETAREYSTPIVRH